MSYAGHIMRNTSVLHGTLLNTIEGALQANAGKGDQDEDESTELA